MVETSSSSSSNSGSKAHLAHRLEREGERCLAFFSALPSSSWEAEIYTEGARWSVRQILAHFVVAERALRTLVERILAGGNGASEDFDIDRFNEAQVEKLEGETPASLLSAFQSERKRTLALLTSLDPSQITLKGRHPYFGMMTIQQLLKWAYQHAQVHLRDIRHTLPGDKVG
jgi:uncharacterized protein (TIGR03083 family)